MIFLDRSRWKRGSQHCPRARYEEYHRGGWGLRPRAQSLPLATGSAIHEPLARLLVNGPVYQDKPPQREAVRVILREAVEAYRKKCLSSPTFQEVPDSAQAKFVVDEQSHLIEALGWSIYRAFLPWLLREYEIVAVEREVNYVIGCTCGLGDGVGEVADHEARPDFESAELDPKDAADHCKGVALMLRPDFITRRRSDGTLGVWDWKATAYDLAQDDYEHSVQMALGTLAAEKLVGQPCDYYYVVGMKKGKRDFQSKADKESGGLKKQSSLLCYDWAKPDDPPFQRGTEWNFGYTARKGFERVPIWEAVFPDKPPEMSPAEWWAMEVLPHEKVAEQLSIVGPCERPRAILERFVHEVLPQEEREWQWRLQQVAEGADLELTIRQNWNCKRYYGRSCEFVPICYGHPGWEKPEEMPQYVTREAHHNLELEAQKAAGVRFGEAEEVEE